MLVIHNGWKEIGKNSRDGLSKMDMSDIKNIRGVIKEIKIVD